MISCTLKFHIIPNSKQNAIAGMHGDAVKVKIQAPAVDGKANEALIDFLSEALSIKPRQIQIIKGHLSREKTISFSEIQVDDILKTLRLCGLARDH